VVEGAVEGFEIVAPPEDAPGVEVERAVEAAEQEPRDRALVDVGPAVDVERAPPREVEAVELVDERAGRRRDQRAAAEGDCDRADVGAGDGVGRAGVARGVVAEDRARSGRRSRR